MTALVLNVVCPHFPHLERFKVRQETQKVVDERGSMFCKTILSNHKNLLNLCKQNIEVSTNLLAKDKHLKINRRPDRT